MKDHKSQAIVTLILHLKSDAMQEKLTLKQSGGSFSPQKIVGDGPFFRT